MSLQSCNLFDHYKKKFPSLKDLRVSIQRLKFPKITDGENEKFQFDNDMMDTVKEEIFVPSFTQDQDSITLSSSTFIKTEDEEYILPEPDDQLICPRCRKEFTNPKSFESHLKICKRTQIFTTDIKEETLIGNENQNVRMSVMKEMIYKCTLCARSFSSAKCFKKHRKNHPLNRNIFKCSECDFSFRYKSDLNAHLRNHTEETPFECRICKKIFRSKFLFNIHSRTHTKDNLKIKCNRCLLNFSHYYLYKKHHCIYSENGLLLNKLRSRNFRCSECKLYYVSKQNLMTHVSRCHENNQKRFQCEICAKRYSGKLSFEKHVIAHKEKKLECSYCRIILTCESSLKAHVNFHRNLRPFICSICEKRFKFNFRLQKHMLVHTQSKSKDSDEVKVKCPNCEKSFGHSHHLERHVQICGSGNTEMDYKCGFCHRTFPSPYNLKSFEAHLKMCEREEKFKSMEVREASENEFKFLFKNLFKV